MQGINTNYGMKYATYPDTSWSLRNSGAASSSSYASTAPIDPTQPRTATSTAPNMQLKEVSDPEGSLQPPTRMREEEIDSIAQSQKKKKFIRMDPQSGGNSSSSSGSDIYRSSSSSSTAVLIPPASSLSQKAAGSSEDLKDELAGLDDLDAGDLFMWSDKYIQWETNFPSSTTNPFQGDQLIVPTPSAAVGPSPPRLPEEPATGLTVTAAADWTGGEGATIGSAPSAPSPSPPPMPPMPQSDQDQLEHIFNFFLK